jgi:hypothetical protein
MKLFLAGNDISKAKLIDSSASSNLDSSSGVILASVLASFNLVIINSFFSSISGNFTPSEGVFLELAISSLVTFIPSIVTESSVIFSTFCKSNLFSNVTVVGS